MATGFAGRESELALLQKRLVGIQASGTGTALVIRGRRQVGKSRLAQEFCDRAEVPYLFYTATKGASPVEAIGAFLTELGNSTVPATAALCRQSRRRVGLTHSACSPLCFRTLPLLSSSTNCHG
jgi:uncharacterized protein